MGRNAIPSVLADQEASHRPPNEREPVFEPLLSVEPPEGLAPQAAAEWERLAEPLADEGLLTEADLGAFMAYCTLFGHAQKLQADIAPIVGAKGSLIATLTMEPKPGATPEEIAKIERGKATAGVVLDLMKQHRMLAKEMIAAGGKFGLNPSARAKLQGAEDDADGWGEFAGGE